LDYGRSCLKKIRFNQRLFVGRLIMKVQCELCPKHCIIASGQSGDCRIRVNVDGKLVAVTYGYPCSLHIDPIEKKPLFHFLPSSKVFSVATVGCNLHCKNCQNWEISQQSPVDVSAYKASPKQIIDISKKNKCKAIAYTYTDPAVFYEYTLDCSMEAVKKGIKNIIVSAGYFNQKPLRELCKYLDAANIDLKALSDRFYRDVCDATLKPVLDSLITIKSADVHLEITNLLLPTMNDSDKDIRNLCKWVKENLGPEVPLHFSRFYPQYRMKNLPPTSIETLKRARDIAKDLGMQYVYIGNVIGENCENTFCPRCKKELIQRHGYFVEKNVVKNGECPYCKYKIYGVWKYG